MPSSVASKSSQRVASQKEIINYPTPRSLRINSREELIAKLMEGITGDHDNLMTPTQVKKMITRSKMRATV